MTNIFRRFAPAAVVGSLLISTQLVIAQSTAFTYQGQLTANGSEATGLYDFQFTIYDAASGGDMVGGPLTNLYTSVSNGLFTVTMDFGSSPFPGAARWLDIAVRTNGSGTFTELASRQEITSTPYAVQSLNAGTASTVTGPISLSQLPGVVVTNGGNITGTFTGDGTGLSNIDAATFSGLTTNQVVLATSSAPFQTSVYASNGVYTITPPPSTTAMVVKLWGAGGCAYVNGLTAYGGGGAFVQKTVAVSSGETFTVVVGQGGGNDSSSSGGVSSGDAAGGTNNFVGGLVGGQASSFFVLSNGNYIMQAVAGGGGAAGEPEYGPADAGAGGNPGQAGLGEGGAAGGNGGDNGLGGSPDGSNYAANATITGEPSLSQMGGGGGIGQIYSGGGGGGYGGGGGGGPQGNFVGGGGGGGGSYGDIIVAGNGAVPGNTNDPAYLAPQGFGGMTTTAGQDGLVVITFIGPAVNVDSVTAGLFSGDGAGLSNLNLPTFLVTNSESDVALSGTFYGDGSGLTNISDSGLSSNVAFLDANQIFTGADTLTNPANVIGGNGALLTGLNASAITTGFLPAAQLPAFVLTNGAAGVNLSGTFTGSGTFSGNGAGLTNISGALPLQVISASAFTAQPNYSYLLTSPAQTTVMLPPSPAVGAVVTVTGAGQDGWDIAPSTGQTILDSNGNGPAGAVFTPVFATSLSFTAVASSADGTHLVAVVYNGPIYTSPDSGTTWTAVGSTQYWYGVASSADGTHLVAVGNGSVSGNAVVFTSTNAGTTWTEQTGAPVVNYLGVASSSDGTHLAAVGGNGAVFTSANSGVTWVSNAVPGSSDLTCVASSADGTQLLAGDSNPTDSSTVGLYRSANSGASWTKLSPSELNFTGVASSANGATLLAVGSAFGNDDGLIHVSTNSGTTWTSVGIPIQWSAATCSSDGTKMAVAANNLSGIDQIYISTNTGASFAPTGSGEKWSGLASSANGGFLVATVNGGQIYTSTGPGNLFGTVGTSATLQYVGNGQWRPMNPSFNGGPLSVGSTLAIGNVSGYNSGLTLTGSSLNGTGMALHNTTIGGHQYALFSSGLNDSTGVGSLGIYDDTIGAYRFNISPSGNAGINTTAPDATLSVNGTADKPGGGSWTTFSDARLKDVGSNFTRGLEAIESLQPIHYHYKADNALGLPAQSDYIGLVAQQAQSAVPESVQQSKSGYLTVNNDPIIWTILNATKELNQKLEADNKEKDAEIGQLKEKTAKVDSLEKRVDELEQTVQALSEKK